MGAQEPTREARAVTTATPWLYRSLLSLLARGAPVSIDDPPSSRETPRFDASASSSRRIQVRRIRRWWVPRSVGRCAGIWRVARCSWS